MEGTITIALDEHALAMVLREGLRQAADRLPGTVTLHSVTLPGPHIHLELDAALTAGLPVRITLKADLSPTIANDAIDLGLDHAKLGNIPLPGFVLGLLNTYLNRQINRMLQGFSLQAMTLHPRHVRVEHGVLRIEAVARDVQP